MTRLPSVGGFLGRRNATLLIGLPLVACAATQRPNVLLIVSDDQGYADVGCHGNPVIRTPHLDAMHARSVRFTDFHVSPTCSPTRCSLMTGRHEFKSGVTHTIFVEARTRA